MAFLWNLLLALLLLIFEAPSLHLTAAAQGDCFAEHCLSVLPSDVQICWTLPSACSVARGCNVSYIFLLSGCAARHTDCSVPVSVCTVARGCGYGSSFSCPPLWTEYWGPSSSAAPISSSTGAATDGKNGTTNTGNASSLETTNGTSTALPTRSGDPRIIHSGADDSPPLSLTVILLICFGVLLLIAVALTIALFVLRKKQEEERKKESRKQRAARKQMRQQQRNTAYERATQHAQESVGELMNRREERGIINDEGGFTNIAMAQDSSSSVTQKSSRSGSGAAGLQEGDDLRNDATKFEPLKVSLIERGGRRESITEHPDRELKSTKEEAENSNEKEMIKDEGKKDSRKLSLFCGASEYDVTLGVGASMTFGTSPSSMFMLGRKNTAWTEGEYHQTYLGHTKGKLKDGTMVMLRHFDLRKIFLLSRIQQQHQRQVSEYGPPLSIKTTVESETPQQRADEDRNKLTNSPEYARLSALVAALKAAPHPNLIRLFGIKVCTSSGAAAANYHNINKGGSPAGEHQEECLDSLQQTPSEFPISNQDSPPPLLPPASSSPPLSLNPMHSTTTAAPAVPTLAVICEYIVGSLYHIVKSLPGPVDERVGRTCARGILSGLCHLHRMGFSHGNLRCTNVALAEDGEVKLTNFAASNYDLNSTDNHALFLKWHAAWVAPEILMAACQLGELHTIEPAEWHKGDIWSLGITLVELLCQGQLPWPDFIQGATTPSSNALPKQSLFDCGAQEEHAHDGGGDDRGPSRERKEKYSFSATTHEEQVGGHPNNSSNSKEKEESDELIKHPYHLRSSYSVNPENSNAGMRSVKSITALDEAANLSVDYICSPEGIPAIPDKSNHLSSLCVDFIRACTRRNPEERLTAEELLKHEWICGTTSSGGLNDSVST